MNDEIKEILKCMKNYGSTTELALLDYITNLQEENERLREEFNGKQLREIHKVNNYDYFKEMTNNWNREDFSRRCYDLCNEKVDLQQRIDKAIEYIENTPLYETTYDYNMEEELEIQNVSDETASNKLLNILRGEDNGFNE